MKSADPAFSDFLLDEAFELMLARPLITAPPDFEQRVLLALRATPATTASPATTAAIYAPDVNLVELGVKFTAKHWLKFARDVVLAGGGLFALSELMAFMFGLWTVSTAF